MKEFFILNKLEFGNGGIRGVSGFVYYFDSDLLISLFM